MLYKNLYIPCCNLSSSILFGILCIYICVWCTTVCCMLKFYVFLCTLSEMTNKTCAINQSFISSDLKAVAPDGSLYLSSTDALSTALSFLSDSLRLFLQTIAGGNMEEQTSPIGQALIQCLRAKDLPPSLYIDLVIQIHHHFGSKCLIDSLHEHQFYNSYKEMQKYVCSSAVAKCWHTIKSV